MHIICHLQTELHQITSSMRSNYNLWTTSMWNQSLAYMGDFGSNRFVKIWMIPGFIAPVLLISVSWFNFQLPCTGLKLDVELSSEPELMCEVFLTPETYTLHCYITPNVECVITHKMPKQILCKRTSDWQSQDTLWTTFKKLVVKETDPLNHLESS